MVTLSRWPFVVSVPVAEPCCMRASICPLGAVPTTWTLLAPRRPAAAACSTSAGDFSSRPLVGVLVVVEAPPHALAAMVTSTAIAVAAVQVRARRIRFNKIIPLTGVPSPARVTTTACAQEQPRYKGFQRRESFVHEPACVPASTRMMKFMQARRQGSRLARQLALGIASHQMPALLDVRPGQDSICDLP